MGFPMGFSHFSHGFQVGQLTAVSECDLCCVEPVKFGHIVALIRWPADGGADGARGPRGYQHVILMVIYIYIHTWYYMVIYMVIYGYIWCVCICIYI